MVGAIGRGLTLADFEVMTVGMIMGYIAMHNNLHSEHLNDVREANQDDFNNF
jgi:hypothetical protein